MTRHDDATRMRHMLAHAEETVQLACGRQRADLDLDRQLNLSLVRLAEIVGEAAARVSPEGRQRCPAIPWAEIAGLRNRLVHGYDKVDFDILWAIIKNDLPPLIAELRKALPPNGSARAGTQEGR
jgi:uncharacterized protein with HEPN domain